VIRVSYFRDAEGREVIVEVSVDASGRVEVSAGGHVSRGLLPEPARARLVADVSATTYARLGTRLGRGPALARLEAESGSCLVAFEGDPSTFEPEGWRVPVGRHVRDLARIARALHDGTLATIDLGLPEVVREEGLLLSFEIGAGRIEHTLFAYDDGTLERWKLIPDHRTPRGERVRVDRARARDVRDAHAAAGRLLDALRGAGPMPVLGAAHDPTDSLSLRVVREGRTEAWATNWGRASRNDAPLEPVPEGVPIALFDDLAKRLRALRDAPSLPYADPAAPVARAPTIAAEWGEVTPADLPRAPAPAPPRAPTSARAWPPAAPPRTMKERVLALLDRPPRTLRALEAVIGPLEGFARRHEGLGLVLRDDHDGLESLSFEYAFDLHHEPQFVAGDRRDPGLIALDLDFAPSRMGTDTVASVLASRLASSPYAHEHERGLRFGEVWFVPEGGRTLRWFCERPAWSIEVPAVDPRIAWLEGLRSLLDAAPPLSSLLAHAEAALPFGMENRGSWNGNDVQLRLHPPLPIEVLLDALAVNDAFVCAPDEDQSFDQVYVAAPPDADHPYLLPRVGPFELGIATGRPRGGRVVAHFNGAPVVEARGASVVAEGLRIRDDRIPSL
jgi:hypothetical protein